MLLSRTVARSSLAAGARPASSVRRSACPVVASSSSRPAVSSSAVLSGVPLSPSGQCEAPLAAPCNGSMQHTTMMRHGRKVKCLRRAHPLGVPMQRQLRPTVPAAAATDRLPGKQLMNPLRLEGSHTYNVTLDQPTDPEARLGTYMQLLGKDFSKIEMPLGATLAQLSKKAYQIVAPRMQIFNIWLQPTSLATVEFGDDFVGLVARQCHLKGSSHVSNMNLDELFNLQVNLRFKYDEGDNARNPSITSVATIAVDLEVESIPFPFNVTPREVLEATGNTAFETTLKIMMDGYMKSLLGDYEAWSKDPEMREKRAVAVAEATANVL